MIAALECRALCRELAPALAQFFERIAAAGVDKVFHPHPFTSDEATRLSRYAGMDHYYALLLGGEMVGYGLLRGWDEGYDVPSLGIAILPAAQGRGFGRLLMEFLHVAAALRGAKKVRLHVEPGNTRAMSLYKSLGYVFIGEEAGQLLGIRG
jgi:ribosomal protein S18 acetylase RimI-like enzyme